MDRSRLLLIVLFGLMAVAGAVYLGDGDRSETSKGPDSRAEQRDRGERGDRAAPVNDEVLASGEADPGDDEPLEFDVTEQRYGVRQPSRFTERERARHQQEFRRRVAGLTQGGDPELARCLELARWASDREIPHLYGLVLRYTLLIHSGSSEARRRLKRLRRSLRRLPIDRAAGKAFLADFGTGFRLLLTPHFRLVYDTEEPFARRTGALLERVYAAFFRFFDARYFEPVPPADRLEVVLFGTRADYRRYTEQFGDHLVSTSGVFSSRDNRSYFYDALSEPGLDRARRSIRESIWSLQEHLQDIEQAGPDRRWNITVGGQKHDGVSRSRATRLFRAQVSRLRERRRDLDRRYRGRNVRRASHEIVHHLAYAAGVHGRYRSSPSWLMEGLAMHFEAVDARTGRWGGPGATNGSRRDGFARDLEDGRQIRLETLVSSDRTFRESGKTMNRAYNAAWSLFQFLLREHHDALFDLMANQSIEVATERATPQARRREFTRAFGSLRQLEARWLRSP